MSKIAFSFHTVTTDWGKQLPDGDFTIGRGADPRGADASPITLYSCPMHPETNQDEPGICALCGMALEPIRMAPADAAPAPSEPDQRVHRRRKM